MPLVSPTIVACSPPVPIHCPAAPYQLAVGLEAREAEPYIDQVNAERRIRGYRYGVHQFAKECPATYIWRGRGPDALGALPKEKDVCTRRLKTLPLAIAYYWPYAKELAQDYIDSMEHATPLASKRSSIRMFSFVTGNSVEEAIELGAFCWVAIMLQPVKFLDAVHSLLHSDTRRRLRRPLV